MKKWEQQVRTLLTLAGDFISTWLPGYPCPFCGGTKTDLNFRSMAQYKITMLCFTCNQTSVFDQRNPMGMKVR